MAGKTRLLTTLVAALIAAVAVGAGSPSALAAKHHSTPPPIVVDEGDYGATIQATVGQQIEIMLQDQWYGRYGWSWYEITGHAVARRGHSSARAAGGTDCYRMRAVKEGSATCSLVCEPPPWLMLPARCFEVTFNVQP